MGHEDESNTNCNWCAQYGQQRIGTGIVELGKKRMSEYHLNCCIVENGKNMEKGLGDLRRLGVTQTPVCPVGWGCRIYRLLLCRGVRPPTNECPVYDTKQSDGEVPAILELWGMRSTPSLPSLPGPLWPGVGAPDMGPIYGLNRTYSILMLN